MTVELFDPPVVILLLTAVAAAAAIQIYGLPDPFKNYAFPIPFRKQQQIDCWPFI